MDQKIVFNGKTYNSVDEMPPAERQAYESVMNLFGDKNQNGLPDFMENLPGGILGKALNVQVNGATIIHNGQVYHSIDELPADVRAKYEAQMGALDANHNGIPDMVEGMLGSAVAISPVPSTTPSLAPSEPAFPVSSAIPVSPTSAIEPEDNSASLRWIILGAGLFFLVCLAAIAVWLLLSAR